MSRSIEFTQWGERVMLCKRCIAPSGKYVTPIKRNTFQVKPRFGLHPFREGTANYRRGFIFESSRANSVHMVISRILGL